MALSLNGRVLHFVFKVPNRTPAMVFYKDILGLQVLRHEEFTIGCEAACNGPYENRWSKTMVGYGPESSHFALELTYNYEVMTYQVGNDFLGVTIRSSDIIKNARERSYQIKELNGTFTLESPGGYKFNIINEPPSKDKDPIEKVTLACSNLGKTIQYWNGILGLKIISQGEKTVAFAFDKNQCLLEFKDIGQPINHGEAFGRIAFSVPYASLPVIQERIEREGQKVLSPLITLETPDKASVTVVILADPDGHEICFVDVEGFSQLSQVDPKADELLTKFISRDKTRVGQ